MTTTDPNDVPMPTLNAIQRLLIDAIHADVLELTKRNADCVLALYRAMSECLLETLDVPPVEMEVDYKAVEKWLLMAMRKGAAVPKEVTDEELREVALHVPENPIVLDS
jgi:hypothetical protein